MCPAISVSYDIAIFTVLMVFSRSVTSSFMCLILHSISSLLFFTALLFVAYDGRTVVEYHRIRWPLAQEYVLPLDRTRFADTMLIILQIIVNRNMTQLSNLLTPEIFYYLILPMFLYYLVGGHAYRRFCHDRDSLDDVCKGQKRYDLIHNLMDLLTLFSTSCTPWLFNGNIASR